MECTTRASAASPTAARTAPSAGGVLASGQLYTAAAHTLLAAEAAAREAQAGARAAAAAAQTSECSRSRREQGCLHQQKIALTKQQHTQQCNQDQQQQQQVQRQPHHQQQHSLQQPPCQQNGALQQHDSAPGQSFLQQQQYQQPPKESQHPEQLQQHEQRDGQQKEGDEPGDAGSGGGGGQPSGSSSLLVMRCPSASDSVVVPRDLQQEVNLLPADQRAAAAHAATTGRIAGTGDLALRVAAARRSASTNTGEADAVTACSGAAAMSAAAVPGGHLVLSDTADGECSPLGLARGTAAAAAGERRFSRGPAGMCAAPNAAAAPATMGSPAGAAPAASDLVRVSGEAATQWNSSLLGPQCFSQVKQERGESGDKKRTKKTAGGLRKVLEGAAADGPSAGAHRVRVAKVTTARGCGEALAAEAAAALPDWVRELGEVYRRYLLRQLSLQGALKALHPLLRQAVAAAGATTAAAATSGSGDLSKKQEEEEEQQQPPSVITIDRLLEAIFRQVLHLCAAGLPKQSDREAARLCAFFYRALATVDELIWHAHHACPEGQRQRGQLQQQEQEPQPQQGEGEDQPQQQICDEPELSREAKRHSDGAAGGEAAAPPPSAVSAAPAKMRYRSVESLWGRLLLQVESPGCPVNVRLGICCFLLHLLRWGCSSSICVAEALQQQHRDVLLQLLDHTPEAALRRLALLLLEHFQAPERSCRVWRAFLMHLNDEAPPVRRAAVTRLLLVDFPIARDAVEQAEAAVKLLLTRTHDSSAEVRAAVYKRLSTCELCLSVENRALVALTGMSDKAKSVREACSRMLRSWLVQREQLLTAAAGEASQHEDPRPPGESQPQHQQRVPPAQGERLPPPLNAEGIAVSAMLQEAEGAAAAQQQEASPATTPATAAAGEKTSSPEDSNRCAALSQKNADEPRRSGAFQKPVAAPDRAAGALSEAQGASEQQEQQEEEEGTAMQGTRAQQMMAPEQPGAQSLAEQQQQDQHAIQEVKETAREAAKKCGRTASYKKLASSGLHALVNDFMECMPFNEAALDVILRELLSVYPAECYVACLKQISKEGAESLRALTPAGLFILRVYVQHFASEADRCRLSIPDLQQMLLRLLTASIERQRALHERVPAVDASESTVAEAFEFCAATEKALLTLCVCTRQLLLLACYADVVEQQQARLLDEACEQLLLQMPLVDCMRLLSNNLHPLELQVVSYAAPPAAAAASGSKGGVLGTNSVLGSTLWPGYWMRCMVPAACMQLLKRLQRVLKSEDVSHSSSPAAADEEEEAPALRPLSTGGGGRGAGGDARQNSASRPSSTAASEHPQHHQQQHNEEASFSSRVWSILSEIREPFEEHGEAEGERELCNIVDTMEPSVEDVRSLSLSQYPMAVLQEQQDLLLQKLLALRQKAGDLAVEAYTMRRKGNGGKQQEQEQEQQQDPPPQDDRLVTEEEDISGDKADATNGQMLEALQQQICLMQREWHCSALLLVVIDNALQERWFRIICLLDAFFAQSHSTRAAESALSQMPCSMLLPGLQYYCNTEDVLGFCCNYCCCDACIRPEHAESEPLPAATPAAAPPPYGWCWKAKDRQLLALQLGLTVRPPLYNDLCEVLVTKSLGCFCLLSWKEQEVARQLKAYHVSLLTSLGELQTCMTTLDQLQVHREYQETRRRRLQERLERQERRIERLQQRQQQLQQKAEEEQQVQQLQQLKQQEQQPASQQDKGGSDGDDAEKKQQQQQEKQNKEDTIALSSPRTGRIASRLKRGRGSKTAAAAAAVEQQLPRLRAKAKETVAECDAVVHALRLTQVEIEQLQRSFVPHLLRCELYCCFLGDLLLCHPRLLRKEVLKQRSLLDELLQQQFEGGEDAAPPATPAAAESCSSGVATAAAAKHATPAAVGGRRQQQASPNRQLALARRPRTSAGATAAAGESPLSRRSTTSSSAAEDEEHPACLLDLLWQIVTAEEPATKSLQVTCLQVLLKLLVLPLVEYDTMATGTVEHEESGDEEETAEEEEVHMPRTEVDGEEMEMEDKQQQLLEGRQQQRDELQGNPEQKKKETRLQVSPADVARVLGSRLRILMEIIYLQPVLSSSLNGVLAYVDSVLSWGYPSQQKLRSFYVLQCFTCPKLPAAAARGALNAYYYAARYMAAHGLRAIFHLHLTQGGTQKQQQAEEGSSAGGAEQQVLLSLAAVGATSRYNCASLGRTGRSALAALTDSSSSLIARRDRLPVQLVVQQIPKQQELLLPPLLRMLEDYKKLLLFIISVFRAAAISAANKAAAAAAAGTESGGKKSSSISRNLLRADSCAARSPSRGSQPDAGTGSHGNACESGSGSTAEEGGGFGGGTGEDEENVEEGTAKDISLKTFELLAVVFLAAEQHVVSLIVLQPRLRFFEAVAAAVSAWLLQQEPEGGSGSSGSQQQLQQARSASTSPRNNSKGQEGDGSTCLPACSPKRRQRQQQGSKTNNTKQDAPDNFTDRKTSLLELSFSDDDPLPGLRLVLVAKALLCDLLAKARNLPTAAVAAVAASGAAAATAFANSQKKVVKEITEVLDLIGRTEQALLSRVLPKGPRQQQQQQHQQQQEQRGGGKEGNAEEELARGGRDDELLSRSALLQEEEESGRALAEQMRQTYLDELDRYLKVEAQAYISPLLTYSSQALAAQLQRLEQQHVAVQEIEMLLKEGSDESSTGSEQEEDQEEEQESAEGESHEETDAGCAGRALPPRRCRLIAAERLQQQIVRSNRKKRSKREADQSSSEAEEEAGAAEVAAATTAGKSLSTRGKSESGEMTSEHSSESFESIDSSSASCFSDTDTDSDKSSGRTPRGRRRPPPRRTGNKSSTPVRSRRRKTKNEHTSAGQQQKQQQQRVEEQRQSLQQSARGRGGGRGRGGRRRGA